MKVCSVSENTTKRRRSGENRWLFALSSCALCVISDFFERPKSGWIEKLEYVPIKSHKRQHLMECIMMDCRRNMSIGRLCCVQRHCDGQEAEEQLQEFELDKAWKPNKDKLSGNSAIIRSIPRQCGHWGTSRSPSSLTFLVAALVNVQRCWTA